MVKMVKTYKVNEHSHIHRAGITTKDFQKVQVRWYDNGNIVAKIMPHSHNIDDDIVSFCGECDVFMKDDGLLIPSHNHRHFIKGNIFSIEVDNGVYIKLSELEEIE